jgi:hypothetical protein
VALVRTDVSEENIAYIIRMERISELRTTAFFIITVMKIKTQTIYLEE